ncbi:MAG: terminase small subunit [Proteobacteria bacterium]|nr:terminase small subunit [Pseudomonadota bacterium]
MPILSNPKHEAFAQGLAKGLTQVEAYAEAGYSPSDANAARLTGNDRIKERVAELQEKAVERTLVTIDTLADELEEARVLAIKEGQSAAAVSASMGKAKLYGHLVDKVEVKHSYSGLSDEDLLTEIEGMVREMQKAAANTAH